MFSFFKREPSAPITQNAPATSANRQDDGSSDGGHSDNSNDNHE